MFMNFDKYIYVPVTTAQKFLLGTDYLNTLIVKVKNEKLVNETIEDIRLLLRERHNIYNPEGDLTKDDFSVVSQEEAINTLTAVTSIFTIFLSGIAAIALIVGGIGIMNIMLVSVAEWTKEIGIRKSIGAKKKARLIQFLIEAITLCLIGGIIGIVLGIGVGNLAGMALNAQLAIPLDWILIGITLCVLVGIIFGTYPAYKAANLDPIEALRYE